MANRSRLSHVGTILRMVVLSTLIGTARMKRLQKGLILSFKLRISLAVPRLDLHTTESRLVSKGISEQVFFPRILISRQPLPL